eukprot:1793732-Amphidinium_carterae.1
MRGCCCPTERHNTRLASLELVFVERQESIRMPATGSPRMLRVMEIGLVVPVSMWRMALPNPCKEDALQPKSVYFSHLIPMYSLRLVLPFLQSVPDFSHTLGRRWLTCSSNLLAAFKPHIYMMTSSAPALDTRSFLPLRVALFQQQLARRRPVCHNSTRHARAAPGVKGVRMASKTYTSNNFS